MTLCMIVEQKSRMLENENVLFLFRAGKTLWSCFRLVDCSARANHVWPPGSAPREQGMTFDGEIGRAHV